MIGETISHYRITKKLGEGGMGTVYKADDLRLQRTVALKFLQASEGYDTQRFRNEALAAAALDHPNICTVYDIEEIDGKVFIAMSYVEGETLQQRISRGPIPWQQALAYVAQVADALGAAHGKGIVHRDIKPANLMVLSNEQVRILDFGIAKVHSDTQQTKTGMIIGTLNYMAPEQIRGEKVDGRSDIWSLGVVLYELLTGLHPFRGENETTVMYSILQHEPLSLAAATTGVPADVDRIVARALQKMKEARYQRVGDFLRDVRKVLDGKEITYDDATATFERFKPTGELLQPQTSFFRTYKRAIISFAVLFLAAASFVVIRFVLKPSLSQPFRSIAVLPFQHPGEVPEWQSDGITRTLINTLSQLPDVNVISSVSAFSFKGKPWRAIEAGKTLGVNAVLTGEITKSLNGFAGRVTLWDIGANRIVLEIPIPEGTTQVQDVAERLLAEVLAVSQIRLADTTQRKLSAYHSRNSDAFDAYLKGLHEVRKGTHERIKLAISYFTQAQQQDSLFIDAINMLAYVQAERFRVWDQTDTTLLPSAQVNCERVLRIDSSNAQALSILSVIKTLQGSLEEGKAFAERSLSSDPKNILGRTQLGELNLFYLNNADRGVTDLIKLRESEPLYWVVHSNLGIGYMLTQNFVEAGAAFRRAVELDPTQYISWFYLAQYFQHEAIADSAIICFEKVLVLNSGDKASHERLGELQLATRKFAAAESLYAKGVKRFPSEIHMFYGAALTNFLRGNEDTAKKQFEEGALVMKYSQRARDAHAIADEGLFQARLGNSAQAKELATSAFEKDSTDEEIVTHVMRIFAITGDREKMVAAFKVANRLNPIDHNVSFLQFALDLERYRENPELLAIARGGR